MKMHAFSPSRGAALMAFGSLVAFPLVARGAQSDARESIVLAGGCFWGMEAVFAALKGVTQVLPGYCGGSAATAHYDQVSTGTTGHAESVQVIYDPAQISLEKLLDVYFRVAHDPTELDYQGPDEGHQYRSAVFVKTPQQRARVQAVIDRLSAEKAFREKIVTKIEPDTGFYAAEAYHRQYVNLHPDEPYIVINDLPKLAQLKKVYPSLVRS
jgi:peptide-methionine (S)-S-oxide reductase